jgi:hypothetical protein
MDFSKLCRTVLNLLIILPGLGLCSSDIAEIKIGVLAKRGYAKIRYNSGHQVTEFGSVIFTRADNSKQRKLADIKIHNLLAVHATSFGGWIIA